MSLDATRTPRQWTTPREKLKLVLDRRKSLILKREDATRYRSACKRLSYLAQDKWDFAEPRSIWPRECVNVVNSSLFHRNVHRDISMGSTKLCCVFEDKNTLTKSQSSWTAFSVAIEKKYNGDYWLRLVSTPWDLDPLFRVWQLWAWEMRSSKQW